MKLWKLILLALFLLPNSSNAQSAIKSIEMIANGGGVVSTTIGFDVTPEPQGYNAYSADWYRDVLVGGGSILPPSTPMQVDGGWFFVVAGPANITDHDEAVNRWSRSRTLNEFFEGNSYEIRFTTAGGKSAVFYSPGLIDVPFELWYLSDTPGNILDDVRMIPRINDANNNGAFDFHLDHMADDGFDDPYSDWIYFNMPPNDSPGSQGYQDYVGGMGGLGQEHLARVVLMNRDQHQGGGGENEMPETGTVFRINGGDSEPFCKISGINGGPPLEILVAAIDPIGLASVSVVSSSNATISFTPPSPGDKLVTVSVMPVDETIPYSYELELVDTANYHSVCSAPDFVVHNAGNVVLGIQPNSTIGGNLSFDVFVPDLGAIWPRGGTSHLYAGSLWVGSEIGEEKRVMDNFYDLIVDWTQTAGTVIPNQPGIADQVIGVTYDDQYAATTPIGLRVRQQSYQWGDAARDDFIIFTYDFENISGGALSDVYPALWLDSDILPDPGSDRAEWDATRGMIYQYSSDESGGYIGLMVLGESPYSASAFHGSSRPAWWDDDEDKYDRFITAPIPPTPPAFDGDVNIMTTAQPFDAEAGGHHSAAIGMVFGADLAELQAHADIMEGIYLTEVAPGELATSLETQTELSKGQIQSLTKQLDDALDRISAGKLKQAFNKMKAFMHRVNGLVNGGKLTEAQGDALKDVAQDIIDLYALAGKMAISDTDSGQPGELDEKIEILPDEFELGQNYPNPFNPVTTIRFDVPEVSRVSLLVYDMLGRQVANLVNGVVPAGSHTATFDAHALPSGAYIYRLETPEGTFTKTMLLLK